MVKDYLTDVYGEPGDGTGLTFTATAEFVTHVCTFHGLCLYGSLRNEPAMARNIQCYFFAWKYGNISITNTMSQYMDRKEWFLAIIAYSLVVLVFLEGGEDIWFAIIPLYVVLFGLPVYVAAHFINNCLLK